MAFSVGDTVTPEVDLVFNGLTFPTAGVSGTVIATQFVSSAAAEGEDDIYDYQVQFPEPIEVETVVIDPETEEETVEVVSADIFWFTSEDLGLDTGLSEGDPVNRDAVNANLTAAKSTSTTAVGVIDSVKESMGQTSLLYDSVNVVSTISTSNDGTIQAADITGQPDSEAILQDQNANVLGADQLLLQELAENFSELQAVIDESEQEILAAEEAAAESNILGSQAAEQDQDAFVEQVLQNPDNPNVFLPPSGQEPFQFPDETDLEDNIPGADALISDFLTPEQQQTLIFNDEQ
jgi:hypothetical protein